MKKTGFLGRAVVVAFLVATVTMVISPVAYAQETISPAEQARLNAQTAKWHYLGAALGLGLIVIGAGLGIGKFAAAAAEGIARQPAAGAQIVGAVSLPLFLLEGVAILGEAVIALIVLLR